MARGAQSTNIAAGQVRRQTRLGSTATYRVISLDADHVLLEVCDAPGLAAGDRLRVTRMAAAAMELDDEVSASRADAGADAA
jgi:hypothetical protein